MERFCASVNGSDVHSNASKDRKLEVLIPSGKKLSVIRVFSIDTSGEDPKIDKRGDSYSYDFAFYFVIMCFVNVHS